MPSHARLALAGATLALLLAAPAAAQVSSPQVGGVGTQTRVGDADYLPLTKGDAVTAIGATATRITEVEFGVVGDVRDNCVYLRTASAAGGAGAGAALLFKDLRLNACADGGPMGSQVTDANVKEKLAATLNPTPAQASFRYGDVNNNAKYDKGDAVYLTVSATPLPASGIAASTGTGTWTLRLTPVGAFAPGSFVQMGDADYATYKANAPVQAFVFVEREDKGWYLMPGTNTVTGRAADGTGAAAMAQEAFSDSFYVKVQDGNSGAERHVRLKDIFAVYEKNSAVPVNSVRIGAPGTFSLQPSALPNGVSIATSDAIAAGKPFPVTVTVANTGATAGAGLVVTRIGGTILDARLSPVLSPGESATLLVTVTAPATGGAHLLTVNDVFQVITVEGPPPANAEAAIAALQERIVQLEARLAEAPASQPPQPRLASASVPGPAVALPLAALAAVALLWRRQS